MKKLLLLFLLAIISINTFAQQDTTRLKFKGIPIDGHIDKFILKMTKEGFTERLRDGNIVFMRGTFLDKSCEIAIISTIKTSKVYKVGVCFLKDNDSWFDLKYNYFELKDAYSKKYKDSESVEIFLDPYSEGDGDEMIALSKRKCTYKSIWRTTNGSIELFILSGLEPFLIILYTNKVNEQLAEEEKDKKIQDEI